MNRPDREPSSNAPSTAPVGITLSLLDPSKGHPIQTWKFDRPAVIRIGRSEVNDVVVGDPLVSRAHIELTPQNGGWKVVSLGRHGTFIDGVPVAGDAFVKDRSVIQLGINGPAIEFRRGRAQVDTVATLTNLNVSDLTQLHVDDEKKQSEVSKITDSEVFRRLQQQAEELKRRRDADTASKARSPAEDTR